MAQQRGRTNRTTRTTGTAAPKRRSRRTNPAGNRPAPPRKPVLTESQSRFIVGMVLIGVALLAFAGRFSTTPGVLQLYRLAFTAFGVLAWPLVLAGTIACGVFILVPHKHRPQVHGLRVVAGLVGSWAFLGLLSLFSRHAGGAFGIAADNLTTALGGWAFVPLFLFSVVGLVIGLSLSVDDILLGAIERGHAVWIARRDLGQQRADVAGEDTPRGWSRFRERLQQAIGRAAVQEEEAPEPAQAGPGVLNAQTEDEALAAAARAQGVAPPPAVAGNAAAAPEDASDEELPPVGPDGRAILRVVHDDSEEEAGEEALEGEVLVSKDGKGWRLPPVALLDRIPARRDEQAEAIRIARIIDATLAQFHVDARIADRNGWSIGPAVTQFRVVPAPGVPTRKIAALNNDLSLALGGVPLRFQVPIPGLSAVGIEVPNRELQRVTLHEGVAAAEFQRDNLLGVVLGNDVAGKPMCADLTKLPHLLVAGATGQGKSVCINTLVCSLILRLTPAQLRFLMIDPKRVELSNWNGLPHLAVPVIVEPHHAVAALRWAVAEMERRYKVLAREGVRNISGYNDKARVQRAGEMPYVVIVIDELADLMMVAAGEIEELVCRIAQLARAVGIHLVIATQRPSTDIITGLIKANVPSRIAFAVGSQVDSRVILDRGGAEKLLGRGDMLYQPVDGREPHRLQGAFTSDREIAALHQFWSAQGPASPVEGVLDAAAPAAEGGAAAATMDRQLDPLFARAARAVAAEGAASVSLVQRKFNVGYSRAGRIVDQLAHHRVIGAYQGSKSREVLMNLPDVDELLEQLGVEG